MPAMQNPKQNYTQRGKIKSHLKPLKTRRESTPRPDPMSGIQSCFRRELKITIFAAVEFDYI